MYIQIWVGWMEWFRAWRMSKASRWQAPWETVPEGTNGPKIQNTEHSLLQSHGCHPGFHWKLGSINCQIWNGNLPSWFSKTTYTVCPAQDEMPFRHDIHMSFLLLSLFVSYPKYRHTVLACLSSMCNYMFKSWAFPWVPFQGSFPHAWNWSA